MKKLLLVYILILSTIYPLASGTKPNIVRNNFKKIKNGQILLRYNQKGEVVEQYVLGKKRYSYDSDNNLSYYNINYFDSSHNIIKRISYNPNNEIDLEINYTTDSSGKILSVSHGNFLDSFHYDKSGKIEKITMGHKTTYFSYNEDETIASLNTGDFTYKYTYDHNKKALKEEAFDSDGEPIFFTEFQYDNEGYINTFVYYNIIYGEKEYMGKLVIEYE